MKPFLPVKAILLDNKLIPFWDISVEYKEDDYYGDHIKIGDAYRNKVYDFVDCVYDLKEKKLIAGTPVEYIPKKEECNFLIGETVYVEVGINTFREDKVVDIVFDKYDTIIKKGKELSDSYPSRHYGIDFNDDEIYCLKVYEPSYILESGERIDHSYKLKYKAK